MGQDSPSWASHKANFYCSLLQHGLKTSRERTAAHLRKVCPRALGPVQGLRQETSSPTWAEIVARSSLIVHSDWTVMWDSRSNKTPRSARTMETLATLHPLPSHSLCAAQGLASRWETVAEPEAKEGGTTMSPLAGVSAHQWVDAPLSSGFPAVPYDVLGRWRSDQEDSTAHRRATMIGPEHSNDVRSSTQCSGNDDIFNDRDDPRWWQRLDESLVARHQSTSQRPRWVSSSYRRWLGRYSCGAWI
jgi:hypothetical protein